MARRHPAPKCAHDNVEGLAGGCQELTPKLDLQSDDNFNPTQVTRGVLAVRLLNHNVLVGTIEGRFDHPPSFFPRCSLFFSPTPEQPVVSQRLKRV